MCSTTQFEKNPRRVFFINRYFYPDISATSRILSELSFSLASSRFEIHVLTSRGTYEGDAEKRQSEEIVNGVHVHRIASTNLGRQNAANRLIDYFTFYISIIWKVICYVRSGDILVVKTDPPLMTIAFSPICRLKRISLGFWCQDLFPEVAFVAGFRLGNGIVNRISKHLLMSLRNWSLRHCQFIVVIGQAMKAKVLALCPEQNVVVIPNWTDPDEIRPVDRSNVELRSALGVTDKFVVAYSGNLGRAHPTQAVLDAIIQLKRKDDVAFVFIGGGYQSDLLAKNLALNKAMGNVRFVAYQPAYKLSDTLSAGDVHLVILDPEMEGLILPSKLYGIGAVARPVIFLGDSHGEIAQDIARLGIGSSVPICDGMLLAQTILTYQSDSTRLLREGAAFRKHILTNGTLEHASAAWINLLNSIDP